MANNGSIVGLDGASGRAVGTVEPVGETSVDVGESETLLEGTSEGPGAGEDNKGAVALSVGAGTLSRGAALDDETSWGAAAVGALASVAGGEIAAVTA